MTAGLDDRLRERFGLPGFHAWQREAVEELLEGSGRVLVVAPTGGGKSLCYQFPATELSGTTVVVSPLIALMEDQVRALRERGIEATWLSSTLDPGERREREQRLWEGRYRLVFVAPERLRGGMIGQLARLRPPMVAIDEAHCISHWGHDFRPDYLRLRSVLEELRPARVLACTATATPIVRDEILEQLGLPRESTRVILRGFARPNLHLSALELDGAKLRRRAAVATLEEALGSPGRPAGGAIVYAATRRNAEKAAQDIAERGWRAAAYHAGLEAETRAEVNRRFAAGDLDVVAATNAFGMGIDRPDIRAVIHVQAPGSIEAYYQEVGRAGRDGQPAHGLLLSGASDLGLRRKLLELNVQRAAEGSDEERGRAEAHLEQQWGLFIDLMRYVEAGSCRHDFILRYFGDEHELLGGCGHCDVCERIEELGGEGALPVDPETTLVVRKALAGVARNRQRAGMGAVAEMLAGVETAKLRKLGLTSLSTHGILDARARTWVLALLRRLVTAGLVGITGGEFPKPYLTNEGRAVMVEEKPCRVLLPDDDAGDLPRRRRQREERARAVAPGPSADVDVSLFEQLRAERLEIAREKGIPAYVVCHDRTLMEIAARRPGSLIELADVHGMGPARLEAYGDRLLSVVRAA